MSEETYNGWSNRETWAIQLHLSNNEGDYRYMTERAAKIASQVRFEIADEDGDTDGDGGRLVMVSRMADLIKDWTEEVFDSILAGPEDDQNHGNEAARLFISDVGSWWRADFYEIAEHWIDEARESVQA